MDIMDVIKHNEDLSVGDRVHVRWTHCGTHYGSDGTVTKVNKSSAKVAIDHDPYGTYPDGFVITQNKCNFNTMLRWAWSNSIRPLEGGGES